MPKISNFPALIFTILTVAQIFKAFNVAAAANDNATEDTDFTFLVTSGYRPETHTLTKYLVSIRLGAPREVFGDNHICGGSIIGPRIILTAAHCMTGRLRRTPRSARAVHIVLKTPNRLLRTDDTLEVGVEKVRVHPAYDSKALSNDIAIAKLDQDINMDGRLAAILPLANGPAMPGMRCTVVGWGRIMLNGPFPADAIYGDIDIREDEKCRAYSFFQKGMLCASNLNDPEVLVCNGDSGGPLICDSKLVGVTSYGLGCGGGIPSGYTDVYYYLKWIKENQSYRHAGSGVFILFFAIIVIVYP